ncbi:hypothetical protein CLU79DRAFT_578452 [Phycomyces nitens]|nr:hypothetical protein CLU79DRAFT_578452 [Phycomyces nitens]
MNKGTKRTLRREHHHTHIQRLEICDKGAEVVIDITVFGFVCPRHQACQNNILLFVAILSWQIVDREINGSARVPNPIERLEPIDVHDEHERSLMIHELSIIAIFQLASLGTILNIKHHAKDLLSGSPVVDGFFKPRAMEEDRQGASRKFCKVAAQWHNSRLGIDLVEFTTTQNGKLLLSQNSTPSGCKGHSDSMVFDSIVFSSSLLL